MVSFNFEFGMLQGIILGVGILGLIFYFIASKNYKKKKEMEEESLSNLGGEEIALPSENSTTEGEISPEEKALKEYIDQYKGQYSREALKSSLINAGNSEDLVNKCLDKFL